jgi:hypothetical protein
MITVTNVPFVLTPIHNVVGIKSKPQTPRGTKFVNLHEDMPKEVDKVFVNQPLDPRGGLYPLGPLEPLGYFGLSMVNPSKPPLPPNRPYHRPLNYIEYVKNSDLIGVTIIWEIIHIVFLQNYN